jgi:hypothetical protein
MNKEDIQKLIGGYATGSLTDEERLKLFEAALDDQELFDTLQQEQPLKDLFDDPFSREQVRRAAAEGLPRRPRTSWFQRPSWFYRPWIWASATSLALAGVLVVALVRWDRTPQSQAVKPQAVKQPEVAANKQQPAAEPAPQPDREKSASEPLAPKPRVAAGKPPAGNVKVPTLSDKRAYDSKESSAGHKGGDLQTRRSASGGSGRSEGFGRTTNSGDRPATNPVELSKNREGDSRDSANERKSAEKGEPAPSPRVNSSTPVNTAENLRNSNESPRNTAETPRNSTETPRNTVELPRKDDQVAALPPPSSQSQLDRGRLQSGPSQIQQPQQVQAPPAPPEIRFRAGAGQIPAGKAPPTPPSQPRDSEGKLRATTVKTEAADEMMKAKTASPPKSKAVGGRTAALKKATPAKSSFFTLARRSEDGSYVVVSTDTIFQPGETVRLTVVPRDSEPFSIEELDATNRTWRQVFPADSDKAGVAPKESNAVPIDIVVEKNQRLRVKTGSEVTYTISIKTGAAMKARRRVVK